MVTQFADHYLEYGENDRPRVKDAVVTAVSVGLQESPIVAGPVGWSGAGAVGRVVVNGVRMPAGVLQAPSNGKQPNSQLDLELLVHRMRRRMSNRLKRRHVVEQRYAENRFEAIYDSAADPRDDLIVADLLSPEEKFLVGLIVDAELKRDEAAKVLDISIVDFAE